MACWRHDIHSPRTDRTLPENDAMASWDSCGLAVGSGMYHTGWMPTLESCSVGHSMGFQFENGAVAGLLCERHDWPSY